MRVENRLPIMLTIQGTTADYLARTYESSAPQLTLRLPKYMESYSPGVDDRHFELQIVVENGSGCSPAHSIELIIREDNALFTVEMSDIKLESSLRGSDQSIKTIPIRVTEQALQSQAFSLPIYAQYRTRLSETRQTEEAAFAINLYSAEHKEGRVAILNRLLSVL